MKPLPTSKVMNPLGGFVILVHGRMPMAHDLGPLHFDVVKICIHLSLSASEVTNPRLTIWGIH